jgi:DNA-binding response OmpR family regulator
VTADSTLSGRVLLVGKRARILDQLADDLTRLGLHVREETDVERARTQIDGATVDVVAVGRAIKPAQRDRLVQALRAKNPRIRVVQGLAPVTPLLVAQVEEALTSPGRDAGIVGTAAFETVNTRVVIVLRRAAETTVDLHRLDMLYRAYEQRIHSGPLERGRNFLPVSRRFHRGERYLVVRAAGQTSVHHVG